MRVALLVVVAVITVGIVYGERKYNETCSITEIGNGISIDPCDASKFLSCQAGYCRCKDPATHVYDFRFVVYTSKKGTGESKLKKVYSCYAKVGSPCDLQDNNLITYDVSDTPASAKSRSKRAAANATANKTTTAVPRNFSLNATRTAVPATNATANKTTTAARAILSSNVSTKGASASNSMANKTMNTTTAGSVRSRSKAAAHSNASGMNATTSAPASFSNVTSVAPVTYATANTTTTVAYVKLSSNVTTKVAPAITNATLNMTTAAASKTLSSNVIIKVEPATSATSRKTTTTTKAPVQITNNVAALAVNATANKTTTAAPVKLSSKATTKDDSSFEIFLNSKIYVTNSSKIPKCVRNAVCQKSNSFLTHSHHHVNGGGPILGHCACARGYFATDKNVCAEIKKVTIYISGASNVSLGFSVIVFALVSKLISINLAL